MKRFIEGVDRNQSTLCPERLEDFIAEDKPVRIVDAFVDQLDLRLANETFTMCPKMTSIVVQRESV